MPAADLKSPAFQVRNYDEISTPMNLQYDKNKLSWKYCTYLEFTPFPRQRILQSPENPVFEVSPNVLDMSHCWGDRNLPKVTVFCMDLMELEKGHTEKKRGGDCVSLVWNMYFSGTEG